MHLPTHRPLKSSCPRVILFILKSISAWMKNEDPPTFSNKPSNDASLCYPDHQNEAPSPTSNTCRVKWLKKGQQMTPSWCWTTAQPWSGWSPWTAPPSQVLCKPESHVTYVHVWTHLVQDWVRGSWRSPASAGSLGRIATCSQCSILDEFTVLVVFVPSSSPHPCW